MTVTQGLPYTVPPPTAEPRSLAEAALTVLASGTLEAWGTAAQLGGAGHAAATVKTEAGDTLGCGERRGGP